ncbi:unnamed protein product [Caenorhabditis brenneri]
MIYSSARSPVSQRPEAALNEDYHRENPAMDMMLSQLNDSDSVWKQNNAFRYLDHCSEEQGTAGLKTPSNDAFDWLGGGDVGASSTHTSEWEKFVLEDPGNDMFEGQCVFFPRLEIEDGAGQAPKRSGACWERELLWKEHGRDAEGRCPGDGRMECHCGSDNCKKFIGRVPAEFVPEEMLKETAKLQQMSNQEGMKKIVRTVESTSDYHFITVERSGNRKLDNCMKADEGVVAMHGKK